MTTLGDLTSQIQDIVNDNVSDSQIVTAINQAIQWYANTPLWWSTEIATFTTTTGDPVLGTLPDDFGQILEPQGLILLNSQVRYPLIHLPVLQYNQINVQGTGLPRYYTYNDDRDILLYTYPDREYTVYLHYLKTYAALSDANDENDFTNYLTQAVKYKAAAYCYRDYLEEFDYSGRYDDIAEKEFQSAYAQSYNRMATGSLTTENIVDKGDIGYNHLYWGI